MPRKSKASKNQELVAQAIDRLRRTQEYDRQSRDESRDDVVFCDVLHHQWENRINTDDSHPRYEINRVSHAVQQVIGEYNRNQVTLAVTPLTSTATDDTAETLNGLCRNILHNSNFDDIQLQAFKETTKGGFGAWRVCTDFLDPMSFDQDVYLKWIPDALNTVYFDSNDSDPMKKDGDYAFVVEYMKYEDFKEQYPDKAANSIDQLPGFQMLQSTGWVQKDEVRIAEYFYKEHKTKTLVELSDGSQHFLEDIKEHLDEMEATGLTVERDRKVKHYDIMWCKMSGSDVLEGPRRWPGTNYIPVIPVWGFHSVIENQFQYHGIVRNSKDSQRIYNYILSAKMEAAAQSMKDPIILSPAGVAGFEDSYKNYATSNTPFLFYDTQASGGQLPTRLGPPPVQQALVEMQNQAVGDLQATLGRSETALGDTSMGSGLGTPSGKAIAQVQGQSNLGQEELFANMRTSIQHTGAILLDVIPKVYDTERQVRITKPDNSTEFVPINQTYFDPEHGEKTVNDLSVGKYDVGVTFSSNFQTQREETIQTLKEVSAENPAIMGVTTDLIAKMLDIPEKTELVKRIRKQMLQQGIIEPNEQEQAEIEEEQKKAAQQPPDPMQEMQRKSVELDLEMKAGQVDFMEAQVLAEQAKAQKTLSDAETAEAKTAKTLNDIIVDKINAEMQVTNLEIKAVQDQIGNAMDMFNSGIAQSINDAFMKLNDGLYQDEQGNVMEVEGGKIKQPAQPDAPTGSNTQMGIPKGPNMTPPTGG